MDIILVELLGSALDVERLSASDGHGRVEDDDRDLGAMLREWRVSGEEAQRNSVSDAGANHTGETHGRPSLSAEAIVMYMFDSIRRRAIASVSPLIDRSSSA